MPKIHIVNTTGNPSSTTVTDENGNNISANLRSVKIDVSESLIAAELGAVNVTMDLLAEVKGIVMDGDISILKIDKRTHIVELANETDESIEVRIFKN